MVWCQIGKEYREMYMFCFVLINDTRVCSNADKKKSLKIK